MPATDSTRRVERLLQGTVSLFGVTLTLYTMYFAATLFTQRIRFASGFLGIGLALYYAHYTLTRYRNNECSLSDTRPLEQLPFRVPATRPIGYAITVFPLVLAVLALLVSVYVEVHFLRLLEDAHLEGFTTWDHIVGATIIYIVTDATWRAYGNAIASVVVLSLVYAHVGPLLPGIFSHPGFGWTRIARSGAIGLEGVYGFILGVGSTWVAIFIMFAGIAKAFGLMDTVLEIAEQFKAVFYSGVVQLAVVSSMVIGSVTGSAAANTATTGSFTIPMMKQQGVHEEYAAAIESVASAGGQMLPPIMGVAAFLMADILGVPYVTVIQAGVLPALLFYFSAAVAVYFFTLKHDWGATPSGSFDTSVLREGIYYLPALAVLLYVLIVLRWSPLSAGLYTILALLGSMLVRDLIQAGPSFETLRGVGSKTVEGLKQGAVDMAPLVGILGSLGVILEMVTQTGLSGAISLRMVSLAGGVLVFLLLIAMLASILFGLGMPTPAAYILVVILVAPGLIEVGVRELTAHMFVFYFAMLSAITPPVALSVAIGAQIAGANFMRSCMQALRIGAPGFVIPFSFITNDTLIYWSFPMTLVELTAVAVGCLALIATTTGYDGTKSIGRKRQLGYLVLAAVAFFGPGFVQYVGATLIVLVFASTQLRPTSVLTESKQ